MPLILLSEPQFSCIFGTLFLNQIRSIWTFF